MENELILNHLDQDYRMMDNYKINKLGYLLKSLKIEKQMNKTKKNTRISGG
jgi:hypothetical protein